MGDPFVDYQQGYNTSPTVTGQYPVGVGVEPAPATQWPPGLEAEAAQRGLSPQEYYWDLIDGYSVSPNDVLGLNRQSGGDGTSAARLAWDKEVDQFNMDWDESQRVIDELQKEIDNALAADDMALAERTQDELVTWRDAQKQLEERGQDITAAGNQLDYEASVYSSDSSLEGQKYSADKQYEVGMANASNDAERNAVQERYNRQVAEIAKMDDYTRRQLGGQQNQTAQFGAETDRQVGLGSLGLENNKFIADLASTPRGLMPLFFMQRGMAPDWETMQSGGVPAQGANMAPVDIFNQYTPTTAAPTFGGVPANPYTSAVGTSTNSASAVPPRTAIIPQGPPPPAPPVAPVNEHSRDGRFAAGGFTTTDFAMVGDAPGRNPERDGARPEVLFNPTHAPLMILPNKESIKETQRFATGTIDYLPRYPLGTQNSGYQDYADVGMGNQYIQASDNSHINYQLPGAAQSLADYGFPITPSLGANITGQIAPQLNLASAFRQRGGGVLPSLKTLGNQSKGETEMFKAFTEGPVGMPWADVVDFIAKPTQGLRQAAVSSAA